MPKLYRVRVCQERVWDVLVEAEDGAEAEEKVSDAIDAGYHPAVQDDTLDERKAKLAEGIEVEHEDVSEEPRVLDDSAEVAGTLDADADRANGTKQANA